MYMWLEEMGLIVLPDIKSKEEFMTRYELLMRRLVSEKIANRLFEPKEINIDKGVAV